MEQKFNIFNQVDLPAVTMCTPSLEKVHAIDHLIFGTKLTPKYNALSEFSFSIPESIDGNSTTLFVYNLIKSKKYFHIENIGYFIAQSVEENDEGLVKIKEVKCESLESELKYKQIVDFNRISIPIVDSLINVKYETTTPVIDSSTQTVSSPFFFETELYPNGNKIILSSDDGEGILDIITEEYAQNWSLDTSKPIPTSLIEIGGSANTTKIAVVVRGFKVSNSNVYSFLVNEVEKAFGCAIIFSKTERKFWIETIESIEETNIFLSHDNLLKSSNIIEYSDEIATSLSCYGESNFSINYANPLGTSKIYNFDYFKTTEWMSQELIDKIDDWEEAIQKEIDGTVGGDHPGEAWNDITWYNVEGLTSRSLDALYFSRRQSADYLYTYYRRYSEISGLIRMAKSVPEGSYLYKVYITHAEKLSDNTGVTNYPYTKEYYWASNFPQNILEFNYTLQSTSTNINSGFIQPHVPKTIRINFVGENRIGKVFTVYGTNYLDNVISENITIGSIETTNQTSLYFKTITQISCPSYSVDGDAVTILGTRQYLPTEYIQPADQINEDDYYKYFSPAGSLVNMRQNMGADLFYIAIEEAKWDLYNMTFLQREKYSNLVQYLFMAYEAIASNNSGITYLENLITQQETLLASAIELQNTNKIADHKVNISYIRELFVDKFEDLAYAGIPSEGNTSGYALNSDENKMSLQSFIDNGIIPGSKTDGSIVERYSSIGGLHQALGDNMALETFISDLTGTTGTTTYPDGGIMTHISKTLSIESFFGALYSELLPFVIESTYQNEYAVNFSQDIKDKIASSIELYNQSLKVLEKASSPRYEVSIDLTNFINLYEYKDSFTKELELGKKIRIDVGNSILNVILLELEYSFDDLSKISMTFGNSLRLEDVRFQYADFIGKIYKTGSNVSFESSSWSRFADSYMDRVAILDENVKKLDNTLGIDLASKDTNDQTYEVSIARGGLLIRKKLHNETYSKQLLLTNGTIAYTTDNWENIAYK